MTYNVVINHSKYRDTPPMVANGPRDLRDLIDEIKSYGVKTSQIVVTQKERE